MRPPSGAAFLLSQLGTRVADRFAAALAPLDLRPAHVGLLRPIAAEPGLSQQRLAERVGTVPSRIVKLLDELEDRGLVERRRSATDRRSHELHLAPAAGARLAEVRRTVSEHDAAVVEPLTPGELATLLTLLGKLAAAQGLAPGTHPGFR